MKKERLAGNHRKNSRGKPLVDRKQMRLYVWIGAVYLSLWLLGDLMNHPDTFLKRCANNVWLVAYLVFVNFIFFERTLPFLRRSWKRVFIAPFLLFAHLMLCSLGLCAWRQIGIALGIYFPLMTFESPMEGAAQIAPYGVMSIFFFGIVKHIYDYRKLKQTALQLRIEKQEAELNYLKSQTNPHFLFNTLNNIYSLAKDKSDLAPDSILRLSEILRFMLYETGGEYIGIGQETKIISDYIALEKLRYDDSLRVNFKYEIQDMKQPIPPLLLVPLVENAFKHGASETRHQPFVDIHLTVNQLRLAFFVKNSVEEAPEEEGVKENIGLSNLRRQLELLYTDYELSFQKTDSVFTATLKINLASHV